MRQGHNGERADRQSPLEALRDKSPPSLLRGGERFNGNGSYGSLGGTVGCVRSKEVQMLEILIVLVIALIVFGPMLLKARKNTDD